MIKNTGGDLLKNIAFNVSNEINNKQESSSSQPQYSQNNIPAIEKISLSLKKVTVKKSAKKLILQVTLKQGKNLLKNKKIIFKFNGKKYSSRTNSKGIAKITIKKNILKKLKVGKKIKYQAIYGKLTVAKKVKVKKNKE